MYKQSLLTALYSDYEDAARKYTEARNIDSTKAEQMLHRMKVLGKDIEYTHKMIDGTMGKQPEPRDVGQSRNQAMNAAGIPGTRV